MTQDRERQWDKVAEQLVLGKCGYCGSKCRAEIFPEGGRVVLSIYCTNLYCLGHLKYLGTVPLDTTPSVDAFKKVVEWHCKSSERTYAVYTGESLVVHRGSRILHYPSGDEPYWLIRREDGKHVYLTGTVELEDEDDKTD